MLTSAGSSPGPSLDATGEAAGEEVIDVQERCSREELLLPLNRLCSCRAAATRTLPSEALSDSSEARPPVDSALPGRDRDSAHRSGLLLLHTGNPWLRRSPKRRVFACLITHEHCVA